MKRRSNVILIIVSLLLFICIGTVIHETRADEQDMTFTIPVTVRVTGANAGTPSPGAAVFHFNIWSGNPMAPITIISNAVSTNGFGEFYGELVFSIPEAYAEDLLFAPLYIQQFDGNADWQFDTNLMEFNWRSGTGFLRLPDMLDYIYVTNVYSPQPAPTQPEPTQPEPTRPEPVPELPKEPADPPATENLEEQPVVIQEDSDKTIFTLPVYVGVTRYAGDAVPAATFHFGLGGINKDQEYEWINDIVSTPGEGVFGGNISFSVPAGEALTQLIETGFDVKERYAVVPGWSFAGEVYHIDLFREDGVLKGEIRRLRNATTAAPGRKLLYFLNYYSAIYGVPSRSPASLLGVEDILKELWDLDHVILMNTFHVVKNDEKWEVSWQAQKEGHTIGDCQMTIRYAKGDEDYTSVSLSDVLRVVDGGIYIKLDSIAEVYTSLCGKPFPAADMIPGTDWTAFNQRNISWLDLTALDRLFRTLVHDAGDAFDEYAVKKIDNGYELSGSRQEWDSFRLKALEMAKEKHEEWYGLALDAAASQEMKELAAYCENSFVTINQEAASDAERLALLSVKFPVLLKKELTEFYSSWQHPDRYHYTFWLSGRIEDDDKDIRFDSSFATAEVQGQAEISIPERSASGSDYLHELIKILLREEDSRPDATPDDTPDDNTPDGSPEDSEQAPGDNSQTSTNSNFYVTFLENKTYAPKIWKTNADGTKERVERGYYYEGESVVIWVTLLNITGKDLSYIRVFDASSDEPITYDPRFYSDALAGTEWYLEEMENQTKRSFLYHHVITHEEAAAGEFTLKAYAVGFDAKSADFDSYVSETKEITLKTSDERTPASYKIGLKTEPTLEIHELTQADNWKDDEAFYAPGDTLKMRIVVKNETERTFYNIDIETDIAPESVLLIGELEPGTETSFDFTLKVDSVDAEAGEIFFQAWLNCTDQNGKEIKVDARVYKIVTDFIEE